MAAQSFKILAFAGSLRAHSYNRGLIRIAQEVAPEGIDVHSFDISSIRLYNEDVEKQGDPEPVKEFKEAIQAADAVLIATPEYNYSVPGVLKNAVDWASRPPQGSPLKKKPAALMGASGGPGAPPGHNSRCGGLSSSPRPWCCRNPSSTSPTAGSGSMTRATSKRARSRSRNAWPR